MPHPTLSPCVMSSKGWGSYIWGKHDLISARVAWHLSLCNNMQQKKSLEITRHLPCCDAVVRTETCWNGLGWETKERSAIPTWCFIIEADDCHFVKWVSGCVSYKMVHPTFFSQWLSKIGGHWLILKNAYYLRSGGASEFAWWTTVIL